MEKWLVPAENGAMTSSHEYVWQGYKNCYVSSKTVCKNRSTTTVHRPHTVHDISNFILTSSSEVQSWSGVRYSAGWSLFGRWITRFIWLMLLSRTTRGVLLEELYGIVLWFAVLCYSALFCTALYCNVLYGTWILYESDVVDERTRVVLGGSRRSRK